MPDDAQTTRAEPQSFRGRSLAVSITATDLQRSITWYTEVVGFTLDQKFERDGRLMAARVKAGDVALLLGQDDGQKGWERSKGEGMSMQIETGQDIDTVANGIVQRGGTLETPPADMPWGVRVFRITDPDGFRLSISSPRPASPS